MPTKIEWTDEVWNPVTGCTPVSDGCKNCYAERIMKRFQPERDFTDVKMHYDRLDQPLHWKKPRRIFVCSMGDLFHPDVIERFISRVFKTIRECPQHTFQILTKRPARLKSFGFPKNVLVGVSIEDTIRCVDRAPLLVESGARKIFVSFEPLLSPINTLFVPNVDWIIVGCESGPGARPMELDWVRTLRNFSVENKIPFFFKQAKIDGKIVKMPYLDGRKWDQYPTVERGDHD